MKHTKKLLSMLLVLCMVLTMLPTVAFTANAAGTFAQITSTSELESGQYVIIGKSNTGNYGYLSVNGTSMSFVSVGNSLPASDVINSGYALNLTVGSNNTVAISNGSQYLSCDYGSAKWQASVSWLTVSGSNGKFTISISSSGRTYYLGLQGTSWGFPMSSTELYLFKLNTTTLESIELVAGFRTSFTTGDTFEKATVRGHYDDGTNADVTDKCSFTLNGTPVNEQTRLNTAGTYTVKVKHSDLDQELEYTITVSEPVKATLVYVENGTERRVENVGITGTTVQLDAAPKTAAPKGYEFRGWSQKPLDGVQYSDTGITLVKSVLLTEETEYVYAVYARVGSAGTVGSAPSVSAPDAAYGTSPSVTNLVTGDYMIIDNLPTLYHSPDPKPYQQGGIYAMSGKVGAGGSNFADAVEITNSIVLGSNNQLTVDPSVVTPSMIYHITVSGNTATIQQDGEYISPAASGNGLSTSGASWTLVAGSGDSISRFCFQYARNFRETYLLHYYNQSGQIFRMDLRDEVVGRGTEDHGDGYFWLIPVTSGGGSSTPSEPVPDYSGFTTNPGEGLHVVLDYGLPTTVYPYGTDADAIKITGIAVAEGSTAWVNTLVLTDSRGRTVGTAVLSDNGITFTPTEILSEPVTVYYQDEIGGDAVGVVYFTPATITYYEEDFDVENGVEADDPTVFTYTGNWEGSNQKLDEIAAQTSDFVGEGTNVHGYDPAYDRQYKNSMAEASVATVGTGAGLGKTAAVSFNFKGTGFDIISQISKDSGVLLVDVVSVNDPQNVYYHFVDTYYGYSYNEDGVYAKDVSGVLLTDAITPTEGGEYVQIAEEEYDPESETDYMVRDAATGVISYYRYVGAGNGAYDIEFQMTNWVADPERTDAIIYQVPVVMVNELPYDEYQVTVTSYYNPLYDHQYAAGLESNSYQFAFDAVRIYNPCGVADKDPLKQTLHPIAKRAYELDGELGANYMSVRDYLVGPEGSSSAVFIDGAKEAEVKDYDEVGPTYGIYLAPEQTVSFSLTFSEKPTSLQLSLKTLTGEESGTFYIGQATEDKTEAINMTEIRINSATSRYYDITPYVNVVYDDATGKWTTGSDTPIFVYNATKPTGNGHLGLLSLTTLKWVAGEAAESRENRTVEAFITPEGTEAALRTVNRLLAGDTGETPTEPTEPTDPVDPTDPTDPVDPTDPTEPTDPVDPTDPTEPEEPKLTPADFDDLDADAWYYSAVEYVLANGLMNGVGGGKFRPNGTLTRAMLVTILYRQAGEPESEAAAKFTDVSADKWYADAVAWAAETGITTGTTAKTFSPDAPVTREQLVTFLWRYAGEPESNHALDDFNDADALSAYAQTAMRWAVENGIIQGTSAGNIRPQGVATRAEVAAVFMRSEDIIKAAAMAALMDVLPM